MADNGSRAIRHPPPPPGQKMAGEKKALVVPPPPPAARRASGNMPAVSQPKEGPFLWEKPAPEQPQPQKPGTLREAIGEGTHKALAATIIKLCRACNLDKGQFTADSSSVIFRSQGTSKILRMPVEFVEGNPEIRIYLDEICQSQEKEAKCRDILREFGAGSIGDPRSRMLFSMDYVYIRVTAGHVSLCGSNKRGGQPLVYIFLHL